MFEPVTLTYRGKAHRCLWRLSEDPATFDELCQIADVIGPNQRRKLDILFSILIRHGHLIRRGDWLNITETGEEVLAALDRGFDFTIGEEATPTVRVFRVAA